MSLRNAAPWLGAVTLAIATLFSACTSGPGPVDARPYVDQINAFRAEKDRAFKRDSSSPIPAAARGSFTGLPYFAIDATYRVPASLKAEPSNPPVFFTIETSRHEPRRMQRIGTLRFSIGEGSYTLAAFAEAEANDANRLFVPFFDLTNGVDTYKGGRYLELERTPTGLYDLDFNRAYHPSCVYDPQFDCPVPPRENRLAVAIRAGERLAP